MKYSYAVDSNGIFQDVHTIADPIHLQKIGVRIKDLQNITDQLLPLLTKNGIEAHSDCFDYMLQPLYTEDRLLFFTKIPIDPSDTRMRSSIMAHKNPDYEFSTPGQTDELRSIFSTQDKNKTLWFMLCAESIILERNLYDGEYIRIDTMPPVPYHRFINDLKGLMITQEEATSKTLSGKYLVKSPADKAYLDVDAMIQTAIVRDGPPSRQEPAKFDVALQKALKEYEVNSGLQSKDAFSNRKMQALHQINDTKNDPPAAYEIYKALKKFLVQKYPDVNGVCYKGNAIYFRIPGQERGAVYLVNTADERFNVGGTVIKGLDALKDMIQKSTVYRERPWFKEIKPYIKDQHKTKNERNETYGRENSTSD